MKKYIYTYDTKAKEKCNINVICWVVEIRNFKKI